MNEFYKVEVACYSGNVQTSEVKRYYKVMVNALECLRDYEALIIKNDYIINCPLKNGTIWLSKKPKEGLTMYVRLSVTPMMFED